MKSRGVGSLVLALAFCGAMFALPAVAAAGSISGTVTASGGGPIAGVEVCATPEPHLAEESCAETNAAGGYQLLDLSSTAYRLRFSAARNNLNFVTQFWDGKATSPGDLITLGASETKVADATMQAGGSIAGTVTDANTHAPVAGFPVCAFSNSMAGEVGRCWRTDGNGDYVINGLPPAAYKVEFLGEGAFNYQTQYYDGASGSSGATAVTVATNEVVPDIDAALELGAEISGRLTEAGTGKPLAKVSVSLLSPTTAEELRTVYTDGAGNYAFRGRPAGTYVVAFSHTLGGPWNNDCYTAQYYKGSATFDGATPLTVTTPQSLAAIDGEATNLCPPPRSPEPIRVTLIPTPETRKPPLKCGKGKKRKFVRGKVRCVKKPKRHHKHHRRGGKGPHAVATHR